MSNINNTFSDSINKELEGYTYIPAGKKKDAKLAHIAELVNKKLDDLESQTLVFEKDGKLNNTQRLAIETDLYIINSIFREMGKSTSKEIQNKKQLLDYKILALHYRMENANNATLSNLEFETLYVELVNNARSFKNDTFAITEKRLTNEELAILDKTIEKYPDFAKLILDPKNKSLQDEYFKWAIQGHNPVDIFVQYPATQKLIKKSMLAPRIAACGKDILQINKRITTQGVEKIVTLPFMVDAHKIERINILNKKNKVNFSYKIEKILPRFIVQMDKLNLNSATTEVYDRMKICNELVIALEKHKIADKSIPKNDKKVTEEDIAALKEVIKTNPQFARDLLNPNAAIVQKDFFKWMLQKYTVDSIFKAFEQKKLTDDNDFNMVQEGIVLDNAARYEGVDFKSDTWYEDLPVLKMLSAKQVSERYNMDKVPSLDRPHIIARSSTDSDALGFGGTHAFFEVAIPEVIKDDEGNPYKNEDGTVKKEFRIYSFGKFPKVWEPGTLNGLKFLSDTRLAFICHQDQNSDALESQRKVFSVSYEASEEQLKQFMNMVKEDVQRGIDDNLVFSFQNENCAHWVQTTLNKWFELQNRKAPQLFDLSVLETEADNIIGTGINVIKAEWIKDISIGLFNFYSSYILPILMKLGNLLLSPGRGVYVTENGKKVWKAINYSEYWNGKTTDCTKLFYLYHPAKLGRHKVKQYSLVEAASDCVLQ